jgi:anti-sigma B factor antagonist
MLSPPKPTISLSVEQACPDAIVFVDGDIDPSNAETLESVLGSLIDDGAERIVINLHGVAFIDSSCLRVFVSAANRLGDSGNRCLRIVQTNERVRRVFDATGLTHYFRIDHSA